MEDTNPIVNNQAPNRKSQLLPIFLFILLLLSLSFSVFLFYQNQKLQKQISELSAQPIPISSTTADPTTNWKTYTDSVLRISYKLPENFELSKKSEGETESDTGTKYCVLYTKKKFSLVNSVKASVGPCDGEDFHIASTSNNFSAGREGGFGDYQGYKNDNGKFFALFASNRLVDLVGNFITEKTNNYGVSYLRIDGKNEWQDYGGERLYIPLMGTPGDGFMGALININNNRYYGFNVQMKINSNDDKEIFDQILSTFKFINESISKEEALNIVKSLDEAKSYLKNTPNSNIAYDHETTDGKSWVIHIFTTRDGQGAPYQVYEIDKLDGKITSIPMPHD